MTRILLAMAVLVASAAALVPSRSDGATVITGIVKSPKGRPLAGLVLLERGEIHNNVWDRGALVDERGTFRIELPRGGQYGVHVYSSGYIYKPQAVMVETGKTLTLEVVLKPEPTRARDPILKRVGFFPWEARQGKLTFVKLDVADPDDDLGPQVMAFDASTGRAYAMNPPTRVKDLKANFPQGVYELPVDTSKGPINPRDWHFVVADHQCATSDILSYPHQPRAGQVVRE